MNGVSARSITSARRCDPRSVHGNHNYTYGSPNGFLDRRDSNISNASVVSDVEMAHDEVFAGPMSESVPSSVTRFAHRCPRSDSVASFTYFQEADESPTGSDDQAIVDDEESITDTSKQTDSSYEYDLEADSLSSKRRKLSRRRSTSAEDPLLSWWGSSRSEISTMQKGFRISQKIYVVSEDLTVVVAGFETRTIGLVLYVLMCILSLGLGYLIFRWLPRWRIRLVGSPKPLKDCEWVVIEVGLTFR